MKILPTSLKTFPAILQIILSPSLLKELFPAFRTPRKNIIFRKIVSGIFSKNFRFLKNPRTVKVFMKILLPYKTGLCKISATNISCLTPLL
jgi:hypothetical protein